MHSFFPSCKVLLRIGAYVLLAFPDLSSASYEYDHYAPLSECPSLKQCYLDYGAGKRYYPSSTVYSVPSGSYYFVCDIDGTTGGAAVTFTYDGVVHKEFNPPYRIKDWYLECGKQSQITVDFSSYDQGVCFSQSYSISVEACKPCSYHCPSYSRLTHTGNTW